jgi:hypothetical protein
MMRTRIFFARALGIIPILQVVTPNVVPAYEPGILALSSA